MSGLRGFLVALLCGGTMAAAVVGAARWRSHPSMDWLTKPPAGTVPADTFAGGPALEYAHALQEGNWNAAITLTDWMQDRLRHVAATGADPEAVEAARQELAMGLMSRTVAGNQLTEEGIEDQYVFAPGTSVEVVRTDGGRQDLEAPVEDRVWLRVTYPEKTRAIRDLSNVPIRSLLVGLNISQDGTVLKANIVGNLDIDWSSAAYGWESSTGAR